MLAFVKQRGEKGDAVEEEHSENRERPGSRTPPISSPPLQTRDPADSCTGRCSQSRGRGGGRVGGVLCQSEGVHILLRGSTAAGQPCATPMVKATRAS